MLIDQCPGLYSQCDHTVLRDSYAWNYRELATPLIVSEKFWREKLSRKMHFNGKDLTLLPIGQPGFSFFINIDPFLFIEINNAVGSTSGRLESQRAFVNAYLTVSKVFSDGL